MSVILTTGSNSRIGMATALRLAAKSFDEEFEGFMKKAGFEKFRSFRGRLFSNYRKEKRG